jgi:putative transposase
VAIDTHFVAYYGDRATPGIVRGQLKASTRKFFVYATACVVEQGRRYTLAITPVESARPIAALGPLLADLARHGLRIRSLTLDKAFFAAEVFARLDRDRIPYVVAVPHHRRAVARFWRRRATATADYTIRSRYPDRTQVTVRMRRVRYYRHGRQRTEVYAVAHLNHLTDNQLRATYRRRFAIESSYRQLRQVKPPTTSRDRTWRLLLIGLGLLFRQLWVLAQTDTTYRQWRPWNPNTALSRLAWMAAQSWAKPLTSSTAPTQNSGPQRTSGR